MNAELLAPAGDFKTALAAFAAGADAVYCGLSGYSARAFAQNFSFAELKSLLRYARAKGRKVYVAFNTLVDEADFGEAAEMLSRLADIRPDALIVQDLGVARFCREHFPELALHASTQLVAHNLEGVLQLGKIGFRRVVLARELPLEEISSIVRRAGSMEFECFIHGALCYSVSGLCLFGAMEKNRSGNRGKCPYCCRLPWTVRDGDGEKKLVFSMRDLRLGEDARRLVDAGVVSLKIEGRMKSELYVSSVVSYYRRILDGVSGGLTAADLETVFSRRTTRLYFDGAASGRNVVDPDSLGHLGAEVGSVKRVTKDRDGVTWLRFHTARALERHDGLQFEAVDENGKHLGMGIGGMRQAISRRNVFEVGAGSDVEIMLPQSGGGDALAAALRPGMKIYCSSSQAVKRMFPPVAYRPGEYGGDIALDVKVTLAGNGVSAETVFAGATVKVSAEGRISPAKNPEKTRDGAVKAFSKLGETDYSLGSIEVDDGDGLFAPMSLLNDLRRDLAVRLDDIRDRRRADRLEAALNSLPEPAAAGGAPRSVLKIRNGGKVPAGEWDEIVVSLFPGEEFSPPGGDVRIALPVFNSESGFNRLRTMVKSLLRQGFAKWEASDLATLALLRSAGAEDVTADWSLYAFNSFALEELSGLGVRRFVASPENTRENAAFLAESGHAVEFLAQQSTPLFISLTAPAAMPKELAVYRRGNLWITVKPLARRFEVPPGAARRIDLSWDACDII